jgi:hypothetical protein
MFVILAIIEVCRLVMLLLLLLLLLLLPAS